MTTGPTASGIGTTNVRSSLTGHLRQRLRTMPRIAHKILPPLEVDEVADEFLRVPASADLQVPGSLRRAPGGNYVRVEGELESDFYVCEDQGVEHPVDDRKANRYRDQVDLDLDASNRTQDIVLLSHEKRVKDLVHDTAVFTGASNFANVGTEWDTYATATPAADLVNPKTQIYNKCGAVAPMLTLQLSYPAAMDVVQTADYLNRMKVDSQGLGAMFDEKLLAAYFGVGEVIVGYEAENTANTGLAESITSVWDDEYAFLFLPHRGFTTEGAAGLGRTFTWTGDGGAFTVETYREEQKRSTIYRCRHDVDEKLFGPEFGFLLGNIRS